MSLSSSNVFSSLSVEDCKVSNEVLVLNKYKKFLKKVEDLPPWMKIRKNSNDISILDFWCIDEDFEFDSNDEGIVNFILNKLYSLDDSVVDYKLCVVDSDVCIAFILNDNSTFYVKYSDTKFYIIESTLSNSKHYNATIDILLKCVKSFGFNEFEMIF